MREISKGNHDSGQCTECGYELMEWFRGNFCCAQCGYDDSVDESADESAAERFIAGLSELLRQYSARR